MNGSSLWDAVFDWDAALRPLIEDDTITEICINAPRGEVFIERDGMMDGPLHCIPETKLKWIADKIVRGHGKDIDTRHPLAEVRVHGPHGGVCRVAVVAGNVSVGGISMSIRKHTGKFYRLTDLIEAGAVTPEQASVLRAAVSARYNVMVSGSTGSGKTTLVNALIDLLPPTDRLVVIEDVAELRIDQPNVVRLETDTDAEVSMRDLVRTALRLIPHRLILGEARGAEAFDLLQGWRTGHKGSFSTIHADCAAEVPRRMVDCILMAGLRAPFSVLSKAVGETLDLAVHMERGRDGHRRVVEIRTISARASEESLEYA
jgi:Flp pilus assembly CpaF family ATPase